MPKLQIELDGNQRDVDVPDGKRLVNALEDCGVDQLHACGGNAKCTTCRVQFIQGEPTAMTQAEKVVLTAKGLITQPAVRLSCQIKVDAPMAVKIISRFAGSGRADAGKRCDEAITPPPVWTTREN